MSNTGPPWQASKNCCAISSRHIFQIWACLTARRHWKNGGVSAFLWDYSPSGNKNLVRSVYEPLPLFDDIAVTSTSEDDERDMFITPVPRQSAANTRKKVAASPSCQGNQTSILK